MKAAYQRLQGREPLRKRRPVKGLPVTPRGVLKTFSFVLGEVSHRTASDVLTRNVLISHVDFKISVHLKLVSVVHIINNDEKLLIV